MPQKLVSALAALIGLAAASCAGAQAMTAADRAVPRYAHIFVIVEENKDFGQIMDPAVAPNIASLAARYGDATRFFGEVHPSEANYVALLGGDTFGIHDDDAFYCHPGAATPACAGAGEPGYPDHTVHTPHLGEQLQAVGLTWKGYYENLPAPGSLAVIASDPAFDSGTRKTALYASKHSGFLNFASVQHDPKRADRIVDFHQLDADLASNQLPSFALIVPNQCNEMHGLDGLGVPADCDVTNMTALIRRGDRVTGDLVRRLQATPAWRSAQNVAIVITFDEGAHRTTEGCCAAVPGGGHIPTIVITNHGPRGAKDDTPYNHYSLLRTFEDSFGLSQHLRHAADTAVVPMAKLF